MKKLRSLLLVLLVVFGFSAVVFTNTETVFAASPRCYVIAGSFGGAEVACTHSSISGAFSAQRVTALPDHCYTFDGTNLNDVPCNQAPFTGPRCYVASGYGGGFVSCSDLSAYFAAKGWTAVPGHCYIFDGLDIQDVDCNLPAFGGDSTTIAPISTEPSPITDPSNPFNPVNTGPAPSQDNAEDADGVTPAVTEREGGFEETDPQCTTDNAANCSVTDRLSDIANVLSAGVGIIIVIMLIVGGIQYTMAGGDAGKVVAAKGRIINAIYALIAFFFLYAFLQWIVPGGVF